MKYSRRSSKTFGTLLTVHIYITVSGATCLRQEGHVLVQDGAVVHTPCDEHMMVLEPVMEKPG